MREKCAGNREKMVRFPGQWGRVLKKLTKIMELKARRTIGRWNNEGSSLW